MQQMTSRIARPALLFALLLSAPGNTFPQMLQPIGSGIQTNAARHRPERLALRPLLEPIGSELQVNTYTSDEQGTADVAFLANGDFVVAWTSGSYSGGSGPDGSETAIMARRFGADGSPRGGEFQVNTWTAGQQYLPSVAADPVGGFVIVWSSFGSSGSDNSAAAVLGQRFGSDGQPAGGELQVNTSTLGYQALGRATFLSGGGFVVVWAGEDDGDYLGIQGQRFSAAGSPLGAELAINAVTTGRQLWPAVAATADGGFVVVWQNEYEPPDNLGNVSIRRLDAAGTLVDDEYQVNSYSTDAQNLPDVAALPDGQFIVVWESQGSFYPVGRDTSNLSVQRRYTSIPPPGLSLVEQQINTFTLGAQGRPRIALDGAGSPVVVWQSEGSLGTDADDSIQIRHGTAAELQVNTYTTGRQIDPAVAGDGHGRFVVVWSSYGSAGDDDASYSVHLQLLTLPIFTDTFESGDTTAWSSSSP